MGTKGGSESNRLIDLIKNRPDELEFDQLVRLIEKMYSFRKPIGFQDTKYSEESIHFKENLGFSFLGADVVELRGLTEDTTEIAELHASQDAIEFHQAFFGFLGREGVLPHHYTEKAIKEVQSKNSESIEFVEIFQHRLLSLFFRAWKKYHFISLYETAVLARDQNLKSFPYDTFTKRIFNLIGLGEHSFREKLKINPDFLLYFSGAFASRSRNSSMLQKIIVAYTGLNTEIIPFIGRWLYLPEPEQSRIGKRRGSNQRIGTTHGNMIIGKKIWDAQSLFRVRLGPMSLNDFYRFSPDTEEYRILCRIIRFYVSSETDFEIQLVLKRDEVPGFKIGKTRVGYDSWVRRKPNVPTAEDVGDAVFPDNTC